MPLSTLCCREHGDPLEWLTGGEGKVNQASKPHLHQNTPDKKAVGVGIVAYVHHASTLGAEAKGSDWRPAWIYSKTLSQGEKKK